VISQVHVNSYLCWKNVLCWSLCSSLL